jgi:putative DNA primase/helicase
MNGTQAYRPEPIQAFRIEPARGSLAPEQVNEADVLREARRYVGAGLSVIPVKGDGSKAPALSGWKPYQNRRATDEELRVWFRGGCGVAVVGGRVSGGLEILDFDAPELFEPWVELVEEIAPDLLGRLPVVRTPSGGWHAYYRCDGVEGNQKLAQEEVAGEGGRPKRVTLIETRGEGGYVLVPPSPAACHSANKPYELSSGDLCRIPVITAEERDVLLSCARSFDHPREEEVPCTTTLRSASPRGARAGDDFNDRFDLHQWGLLLGKHGWKRMAARRGTEYWRRAGKTTLGISATVNYGGSNRLYVFSTNAHPFDAGRAYSPFAAFTFLEHGGEFKSAARELRKQGYGGDPLPLSAPAETKQVTPAAPQTAGESRAEEPSLLATAALSDTGNAECLAALFSDRLRYDHKRKKWLLWDGARWVVDEREEARGLAVAAVRARQRAAMKVENFDDRKRLVQWALHSENAKRVDSLLQMARGVSPFGTSVEQYDADPMLAAVREGTLDLKTCSFRESRREDYLTMQLGARYDTGAKAPRWEQFLREVFGGDEELIGFIRRAVGYSLTGDTSEQVLFLCHGSGANGKSVFLEVLARLLGDYAGVASFETFDAGRRSEASNDLAALKGKRLVTVIETEEDRRLAEAKVKAVTGQDAVSCRFLYGEYFSYRPQFKIWMAMNHLPNVKGTDRGIWRRVRLVPFTQSFEGREDRQLAAKLRDEMSGVLNWALEGLREWQKDRLGLPAAVKNATDEYRRESDSIGQWIEERTTQNPIGMIRSNEAYKDYSEWAAARGEKPYGQKNWSGSLVERNYQKGRDRHGVHFFGLELAA